jgi:ribonuclease J
VDGAKKVGSNTLIAQLEREQIEWGVLKSTLRDSLGNYFWEKTHRRPMVLPVLLSI